MQAEIKVTHIDYVLGSYGKFPLTLTQVGVSKYFGNTGIRVMAGQSDKSQGQYIRNVWVVNIHRRLILPVGFNFEAGINIAEYKACSDTWGCNADTGQGVSVALSKQLTRDISIKLTYDHLYTKYNERIGKETTSGFGLSFVISRF
jgi:hypothetical protein